MTEESEEYVVTDTPLLVNIKGCGYPPDTVCDLFAEKYDNHSKAGQTFPCHYSRYNPWMVIASYNKYTVVELDFDKRMIPDLLGMRRYQLF